MTAVVLGIVSATQTNDDGSTSATSSSLHKVSIIIFLVLTVLQALQTLILVRMEISGKPIIIWRNLASVLFLTFAYRKRYL